MSTTSASLPSGRPLAHWLGLGVLLTAATAALLVSWIGLEPLTTALLSFSARWLAVAVACEVAALACLTRVYAAIFRAVHGPLPRREAMTVALGSFSLSQVLPGGGAAGGLFAAHRLARRSDAVTATAVVVLFGVTSMTTLGLIVTGGAAATAVSTGTHRGLAVGAGAASLVLVAALGLVGWVLSDRRRRHAIADRVATLARRDDATRLAWRDALDHQHGLLAHPTRLLPAVGWSMANWGCDIAVLATLAHAADLDVAVVAIVVAYGVANLANTIPLTPGGIGLVEAGITGTLVAMGAAAGPAAVVAIAYRLVADLLPVAVAGPIALDGLRTPAGLPAASGDPSRTAAPPDPTTPAPSGAHPPDRPDHAHAHVRRDEVSA